MQIEDGQDRRTLERHVQSVMLALVVGGIFYIASSSTSSQIQIAHMVEQLATTQEAVRQTYRADDAKRDKAETAEQLADLRKRVDSLERAVNTRGTK